MKKKFTLNKLNRCKILLYKITVALNVVVECIHFLMQKDSKFGKDLENFDLYRPHRCMYNVYKII